ncbi:MAG TPA: hypothetical protein VIY48_13750 [Candidatus Paceibacterota bacterium]
MAMPITTGSLSKLLWPGVSDIYGLTLRDFPDVYTQIFKTEKISQNFVEDVMFSGFGLLTQKAEGAPINYDTVRQGFTTRYTPIVLASGFVITREAYEDNLYKSQIALKASSLAKAVKQTRETICTNVINRAFNGSFVGGDGVAMIVNNHPNVAGGTSSNVLTTAANLSEAAIEDMFIQIMNATDDRGLKASFNPKKLVIPPQLKFEADRILKSPNRVGTNNNDISALNAMGPFPGGVVVNRYLTSTTAWFVLTDEDTNGLKYIERRGDEFGSDNDWETENAKYKVTCRYTAGWSEWRSIYGTPGV